MVLARNKTIFTVAILLLFFTPLEIRSTDPGNFHKGVRKDIELYFGNSTSITLVDHWSSVTDSVGLAGKGDRVFKVSGEAGKEGYILQTSAYGRYDKFDYTVLYQEDLVVLHIRITTYRSSHGAAVSSKSWLRQFRGYGGETLELGKEIDGVSGGTISAGSLVKDIQRCHRLMTEIKKNLLAF